MLHLLKRGAIVGSRLSHSQVSKFQQCGKAYEYWYVKKIRPTKLRASLLFGTALDRAIGTLLDPEAEKTPEQIFDYFWRFQDINGTQEYIPTLLNIIYSKTDYDKDLVTTEDLQKYELSSESVTNALEKRDEVGIEKLDNKNRQVVNLLSWISLSKKGHYMIEAFRKKVMPKLKKVHSTQEYIKLENGDGDSVIGYIDLVADVDGFDTPVVLDLKTSAMQYEEDSVLTSPQLSLYVHAVSDKYKTRKAGFIVLNKHIIKNKTKTCKKCGHFSEGRAKSCDRESIESVETKKGIVDKAVRCGGEWDEKISPEVYVQFIVDDIPKQTEDLVLQNIDDINISIKTGHFTRNLSICNNVYGGQCEYINLCYRGKMDGLVETNKNE
jgi:hypothetical protein